MSKNFLYVCVTFFHLHRKARTLGNFKQADFAIFRHCMWCLSFLFAEVQKLFWVLTQCCGLFTDP